MAVDDDDFDDCGGRGNSCCLVVFNVITLVLTCCLWVSVSWIMDADFCQAFWYCCSVSCYYKCLGTQCYGGQWFTTRPVGQDMLPEPQNLTGSGMGVDGEFTDAGDGEYDYWSAGLTAILGPLSCLIVMIAACGSMSGRSGPAGCCGVLIVIGALLKIACVACLGAQFMVAYDGRVVYNYFAQTPYRKINTTLLYYLNTDYYMWYWGNLISASFAFLLITAIYDLVFGLVVLCANNAKYTGMKEWELEPMSYKSKKQKGGKYASGTDVTLSDVKP